METKAYTQVYTILEMLSEEEKKKIPEKILIGIKNKMDKKYEFEINEENIEEVVLLEDTERILSVIYTDYLASNEEKNIIKNKEDSLKKEKEKVKQEKYSYSIFRSNKERLENKNIDEEIKNKENKVEYLVCKEKWYNKIINFIKKLINKGE